MAIKWSRELLDSAASTVSKEKKQALLKMDPKKVLADFLQNVMIESDGDDPVHDAHRVYYGMACIGLLADSPTASHTLVPKLEGIIKNLLLRNKVKPRKSQLGHLYRQLSGILGYYYCQIGNLDSAMWEISIGLTYAQGSNQEPDELSQFTYAHINLHNGSAVLAASLFRQLRESTLNDFWQQAGLAGEIKSLRIAGLPSDIPELIRGFNEASHHPRIHGHAQWEILMCQAQTHGMQEMLPQLARLSEADAHPSFAIRLGMWLLSQSNPNENIDLIRKLRKHRAILKKSQNDQRTKATIRAWELMDTLHDTSIPFELRLRSAGAILEISSKMYVEVRLLTLAALSRWVLRSCQSHLSILIELEYRSLCLKLSNGANPDTLGLMQGTRKSHNLLNDFNNIQGSSSSSYKGSSANSSAPIVREFWSPGHTRTGEISSFMDCTIGKGA